MGGAPVACSREVAGSARYAESRGPRLSRRVIAVVGATATGKSSLGIELSRMIGGEVINADSMQLYRGMDIGTAKLPPAQRQGVPHHLLDIWDVTRTASVAEYQRRARDVISDIHDRDATPILVGGSGLYLTATLDEVEFPGTDPEVRRELEAELAISGPKRLHDQLKRRDPAAATLILDTNGRKIVRALEVMAVTGRPFTATLAPGPAYDDIVVIGLRVERRTLYDRIDRRVDQMWAAGFVDEVRRLAEAGLRDGVTARRALGYAQVLRLIDGELADDEAREETKRATRRFARRQESWFGRESRINWVDVSERSDIERLKDTVAALLS